MNIRVDLNMPIKDGIEVVFRSPVDCSKITGLKVYYPGEGGGTTSQEFAFADAHGNNVGDIDHLFAENAVVKVILDVTTSMAFVQNADTNAYLEGRLAEAVTHTPKTLTENQKFQARKNIGAASQAEADFFHNRLNDGSLVLTDTKTGDDDILYVHKGELKLRESGVTFLTDKDGERIIEESKAGAVLYTQQDLTEDQKANARQNIGAFGHGEIANTAVLHESQNLTAEQAETARLNINAADLDDLQDLVNRFNEAEKRIPTAKTYELIATTTVEEDDPKGSVTFNVDSNGNPFELTDFIIHATAAFVDGNKSTLYMNVNKGTIINNGAISSLGNTPRTFQIFFRSENDGCKRVEFTGSMMNNTYFNPQWTLGNSRLVSPIAGYNLDTITEIKLFTLLPSDGAKEWVVGSTFELWGVRK